MSPESAGCVKAPKWVIPLAENKIVHDRFDVMQMAKNTLDKVRCGDHCQLKKDADNCLSKKNILMTSFENLSEKQHAGFDSTHDLQFQTGKAWACKEMPRDL